MDSPVIPLTVALHLAKRLTAIRLQKAWTREILAKRSGVNVHTLKNFELTGRVSLDRFIAIAYALGVAEEIRQIFKSIASTNEIPFPSRKRGQRHLKINAK